MSPTEKRQRTEHYRRSHWRLSVLLMLVWFVVSFVAPFFARELSFKFFNWPFSFWMAAQGAILIYLAIVVVYAIHMNRLDDEYKQPPHDAP